MLRTRVHFLRGNADRAVLEQAAASTTWVASQLGPALLAELETWPETVELALDGLGRVLFCHATPRRDDEILLPSVPREQWIDALRGVQADVVVGGHTHLQFEHRVRGKRFVNPGSVGLPTGGAAAYWARVGRTGRMRSTAYDLAATARAMRETGFPRLIPALDQARIHASQCPHRMPAWLAGDAAPCRAAAQPPRGSSSRATSAPSPNFSTIT